MKFKKSYLAMLMASAIGVSASATVAHAEDLSISGDIGVASQYVWRGAVQKGQPAVQGDIGIAIDGLSLSSWFSNSYPSPDPQTLNKEVIEFDFTADYSGSVGDVGYSVGGIYYTYMNDSHSNFVETYVGLSYDAIVSPSVTVYYTAKGVQSGFYKTGDLWIDLGLSTSVKGFDLSATASFVNWKTDVINRVADRYKNGISLVQVGISKDIEAGSVTVTPSMGFSIPVVSKSIDGNQYIYGAVAQNQFIAALNIAY